MILSISISLYVLIPDLLYVLLDLSDVIDSFNSSKLVLSILIFKFYNISFKFFISIFS